MKKALCFAIGLMVLALHPLCADGMSPAEEALLAGKEFYPPPATLPEETPDETNPPVGPPTDPENSSSPAQQQTPQMPAQPQPATPAAPQQPPTMQKKNP